MTDTRDHLVRVLVEEGEKDAERDVRWYTERLRAAARDGLDMHGWAQLRDEARAVARFCRTTLAAAERAPDPMDLAKAERERFDTPLAQDSEPWADGIEQYQVESR